MKSPQLRRSLSLFETAGLSIAMMAPTAAMALNGALAASFAGPAVPLAFVLAFIAVGCVAFAFVTFARVYASPASVGEFNARGIGPFAGRLSGWTLLFAYLVLTAGSAAEFGAFATATLGTTALPWWPLALGCLLVCAYVGTRSAHVSSSAMLAIEGISVAAIVLVSIVIVARGGAHGLSLTPFTPAGTTLSGLGLATVFALLSFAGFEGAAVLGAESLDPMRTIPRAIAASVVLSGMLFIFVSYAQSIGYGLDAAGVAAFAKSGAPLGELTARYLGGKYATFIDLGASISAFAGTLATATSAARLLYSFAREDRLPRALARVDVASGTPVVAYLFVIAIGIVLSGAYALGGISGSDTFGSCGTIAVIALVLIYGAVQVAALRLFSTRWSPATRAVPIVALAAMGATLLANIFPVPSGPAALYPVWVTLWIAIGAALLRTERPVVPAVAED